MSLDVLRTSSRISAESEISYAERARQGVNCQNSPADYFGKRGFAGIFRRKTHASVCVRGKTRPIASEAAP